MPNSNIHREDRDSANLTLSHLKHEYFKNSSFAFAIVECNKASPFILNPDYGKYLISLLISIRTKANSVYEIHAHQA